VKVTVVANHSSRDPWYLACLQCKRKQDDVCVCVLSFVLCCFDYFYVAGSKAVLLLQLCAIALARPSSRVWRRLQRKN